MDAPEDTDSHGQAGRCHCAVVTMRMLRVPFSLSVRRPASEYATLVGNGPSDSILGLREQPITSQALNYENHPSTPEEMRH